MRGEPVVLVDDILRTGTKLAELKGLLESYGTTVLGLAVIIYQPTPETFDFGGLPLYYLAKLEGSYAVDSAHCEWCRRGLPLQKVWL
jgi:orotate phosphoribosyltransferase